MKFHSSRKKLDVLLYPFKLTKLETVMQITDVKKIIQRLNIIKRSKNDYSGVIFSYINYRINFLTSK